MVAVLAVLRGIGGFGADSHLHTDGILRLSDDPPIVIEIVDHDDRISPLLPLLDEMVTEGMVTVERVRVITYRDSRSRGGRP